MNLKMVALEIWNWRFFSYQSDGGYERKKLHQKFEFYKFKLPQKNLGWLDEGKVR